MPSSTMMQRGRLAVAGVAIVAALWSGLRPGSYMTAAAAPSKVTDQEFWRMVETFSEPGREFRSAGAVRSDNVISNEAGFLRVIPALQTGGFRGAYLGVGPEQNFTFIAALKPTIAFIIDIRRGNMLLHLMYKAIAEMSNDRVDFLCRLFSRPRPAGVDRDSEIHTVFEAFKTVAGSESLERANLREIFDRLERMHRFALSPEDESAITDAYDRFRLDGPDIRWDTSGDWWIPAYWELMTKTDPRGAARSYLASEESFRIFKEYEVRNRVVPLVGDFAGDKTMRAVGRYLKERNLVVAAFYTSNVEGYLFQTNRWSKFLTNVSMLPLDSRSTFVRTFFRVIGYSGERPQYATWTALNPIRDSLRESNVQ